MGLFSYIQHQIYHDSVMRNALDHQAMQKKRDVIDNRKNFLTDKVLFCDRKGITEKLFNGEEIIVSLTSYGKRIYDVYLAIESIMQGIAKPNRIILWLSEDEFKGKQLPRTLINQQSRGLQIEYCQDIKSYKKIVPTLENYPNSVVVTIDDDLMYDFDFLDRLLNTHSLYPNDVCACRIHRMTVNEFGLLNGYLMWDMEVDLYEKSNLNFLTSGGGALFPPNMFVSSFFDRELFMNLAPNADDVWINAMIWLSGRQISKVYTRSRKGCDYLDIASNEERPLYLSNNDIQNCGNDIQIKAVFEHFNLYHFLSE